MCFRGLFSNKNSDQIDKTTTKEFNPSSGIILVQATIYGRLEEKARLVFDTGATYTMLPWRLINPLGIEIDQSKTIQTTTASTVETSPVVSIPTLEVLGHKVDDVACLVRDLPPLSGLDGLLGISFLKYFEVNIDFREGILELRRAR